MEKKLNYEADIRIDEDMLDAEWLEQAALFMKYANNYADAQRDFDDVKQKLDILKAELDIEIRKNPKDYDIEKVTEGSIQSAILITPSYQAMYDALLEAKYENDMAKNAVQAFNMRKDALENLVKLHGQSYFAGPKVPHNLTEMRFKRNQQNLPPAPQIKRSAK
jgi:hypothetical protein